MQICFYMNSLCPLTARVGGGGLADLLKLVLFLYPPDLHLNELFEIFRPDANLLLVNTLLKMHCCAVGLKLRTFYCFSYFCY